MKTTFFFGLALLVFIPVLAGAQIPTSYTNDNLFKVQHDKPVSLFFDGQGGFYGYTENGFYFSQVPITNSFGIRLHRFSIDQAYFYMSDKGLIQAESDLAAISVYFSRS